jgi:hypothetical protein
VLPKEASAAVTPCSWRRQLEFFQTYGALTDAEVENLNQESVATFNDLGNHHRLRLVESDPAETYLATIVRYRLLNLLKRLH